MESQDKTPDSEYNKDRSLNVREKRRMLIKAIAGVPFLGAFTYAVIKSLDFENKPSLKESLINKLGLTPTKPQKIENRSVQNVKPIRVGFIGFGNRAKQLASGLGFLHPSEAKEREENGEIDGWMAQDDLVIELVGICDVFDLHAQRGLETAENGFRVNGKWGANHPVKRYENYQAMLEDKEIDAVIIATPDHHHARITTDAVNAGKHVYCEKSISLTEAGLFEVYEAVKKSGKVFQLGHQINKNAVFQQAKDVIEKNILGKITLIETTTNRNTASGAWIRHLDKKGDPKPGDLSSIDWNQWLGSAPKEPFSIDRFYNWTKFFDYDFGMLGQLFTHEYDAINQLLGIGIPASVMCSGGIYYWKDNREIPDVLHSVFEYPDKELTMIYSATLANSRSRGRVIMGHDGSMELGGSLKVNIDDNSTRFSDYIKNDIIDTSSPLLDITTTGSSQVDGISGATEKYYASRGLTDTYIGGVKIDTTHLHIKEWVNCIRYGGTTSDNIEKAFEEGITTLMAQKSYIEKRRIEWNPILRKIV